MSSSRRTSVLLLALSLAACGPKDPDADAVRGRGLHAATLPAADRARVYEVALRAAFDVGPSLVLLLDARLLPRAGGLGAGPPMPQAVAGALRRSGLISGTCRTASEETREPPRCDVSTPGYVVRFSDVLRAARDTVQVYVVAQTYTTPTSKAFEAIRFEKIYQVVPRSAGGWRVAREARVP